MEHGRLDVVEKSLDIETFLIMQELSAHQKLENQLCFPLYAASRRIIQWYTPHLQPFGITYPQYLVFLVLWEHANQTVTEIGEFLLLGSNTLTPLLKRMESHGWITRVRSDLDERQVMIQLTDQGRQLQSQLADLPQKLMQCISPNSPDPEALSAFRHVLWQLIQLPE